MVYFDKNGNMVTGEQVIDGKKYFFLDNGLQLRHVLRQGSDGHVYYYDPKGSSGLNGFYDFAGPRQDVRYLMATVKCIVASTTCMAQPSISMKRQVFKPKTSSSALRTVTHVTSFQIQEISQSTVLRKILKTRLGISLDSNGYAVTGLQTINGKQYYFDNEGRQG